EWFESDVSSYTLAKEIAGLDVEQINVFINSYGGEVAEGLAIYNALRRHKAKIKTVCDGFACSAASVVFMAGDERVMNSASLLMIHNAWTYADGNAEQLRKAANDVEIITQASVSIYMEHVGISEERLKELMDNESWLLPGDALDMGFATSVISESVKGANQSARKAIFAKLTAKPNDAPPPKTEPEEKNISTFLSAFCAERD
ncbi:MAG: Clp protease ClpP, partial [Oscillospiraceae bacterium]